MAQYEAVLMHGERGGEGLYRFDAAEGLLDQSPVKVIRAFIEHLEQKRAGQIGHIDFEVNGALKNKDCRVVTGMGDFVLEEGGVQPFVVFINEARG